MCHLIATTGLKTVHRVVFILSTGYHTIFSRVGWKTGLPYQVTDPGYLGVVPHA